MLTYMLLDNVHVLNDVYAHFRYWTEMNTVNAGFDTDIAIIASCHNASSRSERENIHFNTSCY